MSLRNTLRKAAELLVELPPDEHVEEERQPASQGGSSTDSMWADLEKEVQAGKPNSSLPAPVKSVEQIVREGEGPNLDQIQVTGTAPPVANPDGTINFSALYQSANLPQVPFNSEQVLEMMAALPASVPLETRRQMIKVSISAMGKSIGASPENIVADASRKLAALSAYTDNLTKLTGEYTSTAERKIAALQAEIEELRKSVQAAQQKQAHETELCTAESHRLDDVLEFFSLDVSPSKYAPPEKPAS